MHKYKLVSEDGVRKTNDPEVVKGALANIKSRNKNEEVTLFLRNINEDSETPFKGTAEALYYSFSRFASILNGAMFREPLPQDIAAMLTAVGS